MAETTGLRAAFFEQMHITLKRWAVDHTIKLMDGQFRQYRGFDGRMVHEYPRSIYHFTPEQWNSKSNQADMKRLEGLSKEILSCRAEGKRPSPFFRPPVILKSVYQFTVCQKDTYTSKQFPRDEVLENVRNMREHATSELEKSRYSEMIGALRAVRDPVLRGRRRIPSWQVLYRHGIDDQLMTIRRLRYGLVHVGEEIPLICEPAIRSSRNDRAYQDEPIAAYSDDLTSTPWQFWMEDPKRLAEMKST